MPTDFCCMTILLKVCLMYVQNLQFQNHKQQISNFKITSYAMYISYRAAGNVDNVWKGGPH